MRPLILSIFALFLAGCTHSQQSMVDTFRASLFDNQDITVADQQIQALPYSTMYLRLNEGQRIFVVLGYIEQEQSKWLSQDNAMLVTHNGRLLKTVKLNNNLLEVTNSGQDPLRNALAIKMAAAGRAIFSGVKTTISLCDPEFYFFLCWIRDAEYCGSQCAV